MKKLLFLFTITLVGITLTVNVSAKTIVTDGLVSYWTFDRNTINGTTVKDVWGGNDATIVGIPKVTDGYQKQGIELDGTKDYVNLLNVGNFGRQIGPYTFEAWFKTSNKNSWGAIYKVNEPPCGRNNTGHGILINASWSRNEHHKIDTKMNSIIVERSRKTGETGCAGGSSTSIHPISDGKWHHIVYTTRPATDKELDTLRHFHEKAKIQRPVHVGENCQKSAAYLDLELIGGSTGCVSPNDIRPYIQPIFLGAVNDMGKTTGFFQGVFDEVRIYNRALTHDEVIHNFESDIGLGVEPVQKLPTVWGALKSKQ